jgi:type IV secretion system pilin
MRLTHSPVRRRPDRRSSDRRPRRGPVTPPRGDARRARRATSCTSRPTTPASTTPRMSSVSAGRRRTTLRRNLALLTGVAVVALFVPVSAAHADTVVVALAGSVDQVLTNIRNWVMGILAGLATVFLSIGGVRRVMGGGDPGEQEKAKECFKAAAIGYGLAALAPLVVTVLQGIVGA